MNKGFTVYVSPLEMDSVNHRLVELPMEQEKLDALQLELNTGSPLYTEVSDFCGREYLEEHLPEDMDLTELNLLAEKLASDSAMGSYAGIILGAGLGCTLVFTIPVGMGMVKEENKPYFAKGIVLGLLGLPFALIIGGILSGLSIGRILWETVFPMSIAAICGIGLAKFSALTMKIFGAYVKVLRVILLGGLMFGAIAHTLHISEKLEMTPVLEAMGVVCSISVFLLGSIPITMLLQKLLQRPFTWIGRRIGLDSVSMTGFLITCVSPLPTLALMKDMNPKGKLLNVAFMVSGASAIGAHLAFVNSVEPEMTGALLGSKLLGGLLTVGVAYLMGNNGKLEK